MRGSTTRWWLLWAAPWTACGGTGGRDVVEPRQVSPASGKPELERVTDLAEVLAAGSFIFTDVEISHDLKWVVSAATRVASGAGGKPEYGLALLPLDGGAREVRFLRLGEADESAILARGVVALAP